MGCLIAIPIILLCILIFFGATILRIIGLLFGFPRQRMNSSNSGEYQRRNRFHDDDDYQQHRHSPRPRRKIFDDDEGEYVDYEEIKDDK